MSLIAVFGLLVVYQLKHFLADYPLQRPWMLGKFKDKGWALPLAAHAFVHAVFTFFIALLFLAVYKWDAIRTYAWDSSPLAVAWPLALLDFAVHFTMDRIKASKKLLGRYEALSKSEMQAILSYKDTVGLEKWEPQLRSNRLFWYALGFDQLIHHLTHYAIIAILVTR